MGGEDCLVLVICLDDAPIARETAGALVLSGAASIGPVRWDAEACV